MGKTVRFGVSLDSDLLDRFDTLCEANAYSNRSEAVRDLIRNKLVDNEWEHAEGELAGTLALVYDHHHRGLSQKLTQIQHDDHDCILSTLHVHLDHHNCLEVLVLKGSAEQLKRLSDRLISTKGVKHGKLGLTTTGKAII